MAAPYTEPALLTVDDVMAMPDDGDRLELLRGELLRMPPTGFEHGRFILRLGGVLERFVDEHSLGYVSGGDPGFILGQNRDSFLAPDVAFIRTDRLPEDDSGILHMVPDLVIEVISPSDRFNDVTAKVETYLSAGVRRVWIIQPNRKRVFAYSPESVVRELIDGDILDGDDVVPGFTIAVAEIFRR